MLGISCQNASREAGRPRGRPGRNGGPTMQGSAVCATTPIAKASPGRTGVCSTTAWPDLGSCAQKRATQAATGICLIFLETSNSFVAHTRARLSLLEKLEKRGGARGQLRSAHAHLPKPSRLDVFKKKTNWRKGSGGARVLVTYRCNPPRSRIQSLFVITSASYSFEP